MASSSSVRAPKICGYESFASPQFRQFAISLDVKPFLPGHSISDNHPFVLAIDEWHSLHSDSKSWRNNPEAMLAHPGNPLFVVVGEDGRDYVVTDKGSVSQFADKRAKALAEDVLSDVGDDLKGIPSHYLTEEVFLPSDGRTQFSEFNSKKFEEYYVKQEGKSYISQFLKCGVTTAKALSSAQREKKHCTRENAKGGQGQRDEVDEVVDEVMRSTFIVNYVRQRAGYFRPCNNVKFKGVTNKKIEEHCRVDAKELSGLKRLAWSPLFVRELASPQITANVSKPSRTLTAKFAYGEGRFFNRGNLRTEAFQRGAKTSCFADKVTPTDTAIKRVATVRGFVRPSHVRFCGDFAVDKNEKDERRKIMAEIAEQKAQRLRQAGFEPQYSGSGCVGSIGGGSSDAGRASSETESFYEARHHLTNHGSGSGGADESAARIVLLLDATRQHHLLCPFVVELATIKSVLVYVGSFVRLYAELTRDKPDSLWEKATTVLLEIAKTLNPCQSWWIVGTAFKGTKLKARTFSLLDFRESPYGNLQTIANDLLRIHTERDLKKLKLLEKELEAKVNREKHYAFVPVVDQRYVYYPRSDDLFFEVNAKEILTEDAVKSIFDGRVNMPDTMGSAPVSIGIYESGQALAVKPNLIIQMGSIDNPTNPMLVYSVRRAEPEHVSPGNPEMVQYYIDQILDKYCTSDVMSEKAVTELVSYCQVPEEAQDAVITGLLSILSSQLKTPEHSPSSLQLPPPPYSPPTRPSLSLVPGPSRELRQGPGRHKPEQQGEEEKVVEDEDDSGSDSDYVEEDEEDKGQHEMEEESEQETNDESQEIELPDRKRCFPRSAATRRVTDNLMAKCATPRLHCKRKR